jgi:hypothetical protein
MELQQNLDPINSCLTQTLAGYEVIPANFGWHIHKGDTYFGLLQYQETKGWYGSAFTQLPINVQEQLRKQAQSPYSTLEVAA